MDVQGEFLWINPKMVNLDVMFTKKLINVPWKVYAINSYSHELVVDLKKLIINLYDNHKKNVEIIIITIIIALCQTSNSVCTCQ